MNTARFRSTAAGLAATIGLLLSIAPAEPGPVDRFRKDQEAIRRAFLTQREAITKQFDAFARDIAIRSGGVVLSSPIALPMQGSPQAFNLRAHDTPPGARGAERVFAVVRTAYALRAQPEISLDRGHGIADVSVGERVEVVLMLRAPLEYQEDREMRWCLVRQTNGDEGYMPNTYLRGEKEPEAPPKEDGILFVKDTRGAQLRQESSEEAALLAFLPFRTRLRVLRHTKTLETIDGVRDYWVFVEHGKQRGWTFNGVLAPVVIKPFGQDDGKPFLMPVDGSRTSGFGSRVDPITKKAGAFHSGVDIAAPTGTPILAALKGIVVSAESSGGYGNLVILEHENGLFTYYAHQSRMTARKGQELERGQVLGYVGSTGRSTGPHLHFEVRSGENAKDPAAFLPL